MGVSLLGVPFVGVSLLGVPFVGVSLYAFVAGNCYK